jgi:hypothetical protein
MFFFSFGGFLSQKPRSVLNSLSHQFNGQCWVLLGDGFGGLAIGEPLHDLFDTDAGARNAGLALQDGRVGNDIGEGIHWAKVCVLLWNTE